ncbi:DUF4199 domain-containing protein [Marinigracilibium pacificum]|uniref:DUF4199 domain-containing protein n=1 Tax=Marinigracilibium pacificum TaxID=2729599 RepID=A0A848J0G0_9BACT|nr:DUF4199 domain-containing protein [Marinigracilibium pacificum]NMM50273.1 DUF4199 domain-containing protein [Marinigracilibium pacificum]
MIKLALRYGGFAILVLIISFVSLYYLGQKPFLNFNTIFIDGLSLLALIGVAVYEFKRYKQNGELRFWQGMSMGMIIYIMAALGFALFLFIFMSYIEPESLAIYKSDSIEFYKRTIEMYPDKHPKEQQEAYFKSIQEVTISGIVIKESFKKLLLGLLVTPVIAIFMRK